MSEQVREAVFAKYDAHPGCWFVELYDERWQCDGKTLSTGRQVDSVMVPFEVPAERQCETMYVLQRLPDHLMAAALDLVAYGVSLNWIQEAQCES